MQPLIVMNLSPPSQASIQEIRKRLPSDQRIVFVHGTFNIVHPGHLRLLRFAAECGEHLVVGVLADGLAENAQLNEDTRLDGVSAISWVNHAFILNDAPADFIAALRPALVVKGKEHENAFNPELAAVQAYGGQLMFGSGDTTFSSLELLRKETELINHSSIAYPKEYLDRHGIVSADFNSVLAKMRSLKVCVIGDVIVDEYIQCDPIGMSQEDPTIVVAPIISNTFLGGAGIVAGHARGLGARQVSLFSVTGDDETSRQVREKLTALGVQANLCSDDSRPTTLKQRYRAVNKTLLRVNRLRNHKINKGLQQKLWDRLIAELADTDLLIFADFNYGVLPQELVDRITVECAQRGIPMVADSQSSSQIGDISRFKNMALLTPTEREARLALGNFEDGLVVIAEALRKKANAKNVVITLGAEGLLLHSNIPSEGQWITDRLIALNSAPKDTAGAGDCLLVCTAMAMVVGRPIWEASYLGSVAAACHVGRLGNVPLTANELLVETNKMNGTVRV